VLRMTRVAVRQGPSLQDSGGICEHAGLICLKMFQHVVTAGIQWYTTLWYTVHCILWYTGLQQSANSNPAVLTGTQIASCRIDSIAMDQATS